MLKRVVLLIATNIAVLLVLSVVARLLGVDRILDQQGGINFQALLVFCAVFGFGGAFISLLMSKWVAKRSTGARVITQPRDATEAWLFETVQKQARQAGIGMPEVAVYDSPDLNAFATGARRDAALVAVSTGLLQRMDRREVEAVLGHEITHVANGDMVTLTLIQGVVNTFVLFLSRVIGYLVDTLVFRSDRDSRSTGPGFFITSMIAQVLLGILASMIVAWFSRQREFRADAGGASLAGRDGMIAALERLKTAHAPGALPDSMKAFGISGAGGISRLFMSHPPLDERIAALRSTGQMKFG